MLISTSGNVSSAYKSSPSPCYAPTPTSALACPCPHCLPLHFERLPFGCLQTKPRTMCNTAQLGRIVHQAVTDWAYQHGNTGAPGRHRKGEPKELLLVSHTVQTWHDPSLPLTWRPRLVRGWGGLTGGVPRRPHGVLRHIGHIPDALGASSRTGLLEGRRPLSVSKISLQENRSVLSTSKTRSQADFSGSELSAALVPNAMAIGWNTQQPPGAL